MPSLNQYNKLDPKLKERLVTRTIKRSNAYFDHNYDDSVNRILLVGDRPKASKDPNLCKIYVPFNAYHGSSLFINLELEKWNINEENLFWENAANADGVETPCGILEYPFHSIIALGKNAEKWVKSHGKSCALVPHPSYWKRFHHSEPYPLGPLLATME